MATTNTKPKPRGLGKEASQRLNFRKLYPAGSQRSQQVLRRGRKPQRRHQHTLFAQQTARRQIPAAYAAFDNAKRWPNSPNPFAPTASCSRSSRGHRPRQSGKYEIIAGERRWQHAAQIAGLQVIPVIVRDITDKQALELALVENIQRQDLLPLRRSRRLPTH